MRFGIGSDLRLDFKFPSGSSFVNPRKVWAASMGERKGTCLCIQRLVETNCNQWMED